MQISETVEFKISAKSLDSEPYTEYVENLTFVKNVPIFGVEV